MNNNFNIGDKVSVIDDAIDGIIVEIKNKEITIETSQGFSMIYNEKELVKISNINDLALFNKSEALYTKSIDVKPTRKQIEAQKQLTKVEKGTPNFDLHIEKLVKTKAGMSNFDILNLQIDTAKRHIDFAIKNRIPKIVLVHGVGEGILKTELEYLFKKYPQISFQEANYQKYGLGATELYFKQNTK